MNERDQLEEGIKYALDNGVFGDTYVVDHEQSMEDIRFQSIDTGKKYVIEVMEIP